ncbi:flagellar hook-length control protein FliK [Geobacillus thermodenitrificans]|uniref:flagellar hook-length control protein FliK n=1 Tax=Geobacillus thermodenitrificans TaxID=33940 RepID=UPI002DF869C8|nr:flagellar hook-length control protein FliK [Geobacillus thermodenitrificans]
MKTVIAASLSRSMSIEMTPTTTKKETGMADAFAALFASKQAEAQPVETEEDRLPSLSENKTERTDEQDESAELPVLSMQVGGTFSAQSIAQGSDDRLLAGMSEKGRGKQSDGMFEEYGKGKQSGGERAMNADSQQAVWFALQEEGASPAQSIAQGSDGRLLTVVKGEKGHNDSFIVADVKGRDIRNMMLLLDHGETRPTAERIENIQSSAIQRLFQAVDDSNALDSVGRRNGWAYRNLGEEAIRLNGANTSIEPFFPPVAQKAEYEAARLAPLSASFAREQRFGPHRENHFVPDGHMTFSANIASLLSVDASSDSQASRTEAGKGSSLIDQVARALRLGRWMKLPGGAAQLVIRLHPEHLGTVTVKMVHEGGKLAAKLLVANEAVKELLQAHLPQLAQLLDASHITVEKWTVWTDFEGSSMPPYSEKRQGGRQHGESQQEQRREPSPSSPFALDGIEADV